MWKQLLRVRPVVEVRSLAVSECLEGLHLKDSNSFLEDESQGVDDPKILKITAEDDRSRSRDREGTSPARKIFTSLRLSLTNLLYMSRLFFVNFTTSSIQPQFCRCDA